MKDDWSRPLTRPLDIPGIIKIKTLADVPIPSAWLRRNVFQPCDGGLLFLPIYLATVVWPIVMPSLSSSP